MSSSEASLEFATLNQGGVLKTDSKWLLAYSYSYG